MKDLGIYVHIPFCKRKCDYCDFISFENKEQLIEQYVKKIQKEILNSENLEDYTVSTIYLGGGTPSYIQSKYIKEILVVINEKFNVSEDAEITIEVNPGTVNIQKFKAYKKAGINRVSIGLQSTKNDLLKLIGRIHNYEEFLETYKQARKVGFENINIDLMIGIPNQTIQDIKKSLEDITRLNPEHISVYSLIVEEETPICDLIEQGKLKLPEEELERNMYWYVKNYLELNGYNHYEISNFSKPKYESIHNTNCWKQHEYKGFGIAAHSYIDKNRFSNIGNLDKYIENIEDDNFGKNIIIQEKQNEIEQMKEYMLLGLRKIDGVSIQEFKNKFTENPIFLFKQELNKLSKEELIVINEDKIKLTNKGLDLANIVWEEFI